MGQRIRRGRVLGFCAIAAAILSFGSYSLGQTHAQSRDAKLVKSLPGMGDWTLWGQTPRYFTRNRVPHMTSYLENGDQDQLMTYRSFVPGDDSELQFTVHGGRCKVYLVLEPMAPKAVENLGHFEKQLESGSFGRIIESVAGPKTDDFDILVRWYLEPYRGQRLGVYLVDSSQGSWGFISASEFSFKNCDLSSH